MALITGGNRGPGLAMAETYGVEVVSTVCDVTSEENVQAAVENTIPALEGLTSSATRPALTSGAPSPWPMSTTCSRLMLR